MNGYSCVRSGKKRATLTLLATFMVIIIPILLVLGVTLLQASTLVNDLTSFVENQDFGRIAQNAQFDQPYGHKRHRAQPYIVISRYCYIPIRLYRRLRKLRAQYDSFLDW